ncbi:carboxylesterase family protein [Pseudoxanthomonas sp. USHLN014]|uniref:carboxylesterase/lipase family protein n=1 Tax=Pseudoxanthomonas sp. USHLN014 TaxID=3081297 RepID=UPI00301E5CAE
MPSLLNIPALVLLLAALAPTAARAQSHPVAETLSGRVQGVSVEGVESFKGIPYAAPPTGALRWRAPQPAAHWQGVRDASHYGAPCIQPAKPGQWAVEPSEDCLNLNLWRPVRDGVEANQGKLPVMLWIHGGGSVVGSGSDPAFDGSALARHGVVVVTINYRLGRLGYFAHPALSAAKADGPLLGNYGLMDQLAAMRWVRENIAAFGGDPGNVTLFGESAGGCYVSIWMTSPAAQGLFSKAITHSCPGFILSEPLAGQGSAETRGQTLAQTLGIKGRDAKALAALRKLPASAFLQPAFFKGTYPVLDGVLVQQDPYLVVLNGKTLHKPWILGSNSFDSSYMPYYGIDLSHPLAGYPNDADNIRAVYRQAAPEGSEQQLGTAFLSDIDMAYSDRMYAQVAARDGVPTYTYAFDHLPAAAVGELPGVPHGGELAFVFGAARMSAGPDRSFPLDAQDKAFSQQVMTYWTNFAKTGEPGTAQTPWPAYAQGETTMVFSQQGGPHPVSGYHRERLDFAAPFAWKRISRWDP